MNLYLTDVLPVESSRGCHWAQCTFCDHWATVGRNGRIKPAATLAAEVAHHHGRYQANRFHFVNDSWCLEETPNVLCALGSAGPRWMTYLRPDSSVDRAALRMLFEAGCRVLEWGIESFSQATLRSLRKGTEVSHCVKLLNAAHEMGFVNHVFMMFGVPGESAGDVRTSCDTYLDMCRQGVVRPQLQAFSTFQFRAGTIASRSLPASSVMTPSFDYPYRSAPVADASAAYVNQCIEAVRELLAGRGQPDCSDEAATLDLVDVGC